MNDFKASAAEQWAEFKVSFKRSYDELQRNAGKLKQQAAQKAANARRKVFDKNDKEIAAEIEGGGARPGEGEEGGGKEGFIRPEWPQDQPEAISARRENDLVMMP